MLAVPQQMLSAAPSADSGVLVGAALGTVIALLVGALVAYQYQQEKECPVWPMVPSVSMSLPSLKVPLELSKFLENGHPNKF
jgi:hypothetical protein